jgi:hypothetical protein
MQDKMRLSERDIHPFRSSPSRVAVWLLGVKAMALGGVGCGAAPYEFSWVHHLHCGPVPFGNTTLPWVNCVSSLHDIRRTALLWLSGQLKYCWETGPYGIHLGGSWKGPPQVCITSPHPSTSSPPTHFHQSCRTR